MGCVVRNPVGDSDRVEGFVVVVGLIVGRRYLERAEKRPNLGTLHKVGQKLGGDGEMESVST